MVVARHHRNLYIAFYLTILGGITGLGFELAAYLSMETPLVDPFLPPSTIVVNMLIYALPTMSVGRPLPLLLVDSEKFWFATWLLDFLLKVMVVGFVLLGGLVLVVISRAHGGSLVPTLLFVLVISYLWLSHIIVQIRTLWVYKGNRVPR